MKKNQIEKLDKINEEKKLTQEAKNRINTKIFNNYLIAINILLLFIFYIIVFKTYKKEIAILVYRTSSVLLLGCTLYGFEKAYKSDNDQLAIHTIELLFISIISLLTPYIFIEKHTFFTLTIGIDFTIYYIIKSLFIYRKEKSNYIKEQSDIREIIKKESQDKLALKEKESNKIEAPKKKRGRPKKIESKK